MIRFLKLSTAAVLAFALLGAPAFAAADFTAPEGSTGRGEIKGGTAKKYMAVAAHPLASQAGADILKAGGSAVDAAVAIQLVLSQVEPQSSGIGGGAFLLHWDAKSGTLKSYDGRETAPAAATEQRFIGEDGKPMSRRQAIIGGKSVGVPGVMRMLELAHQRHGKLPWAKLFEPAIHIADDGFAMGDRLYQLLAADGVLNAIEPAKSYYYQPDGTPKPVGTLMKNPEFAKVLRELAGDGAEAFYTGRIAADIVRTVTTAAQNPSDMTLEDLKTYQPKEREPLCGAYRVYKICGMGPPSSGGIGVLQTLGILERFDLKAMGVESLGVYALFADASRLAFADRAVYIADPDVIPVPTAALVAPAYLKERSALVSPTARLPKADAGKVPVKGALNLVPAASPERPSTTHYSIVDADGNAVAMTTTVEGAFGSHLMVNGFLLNNQLTDFSYGEAARGETVANRVQGGKRPRSSMSPTIVFNQDGKMEMVVGSPGGPAIVPFVAKTLIGMIDGGLSPAEAVALPNLIAAGDRVMVEQGTALEALKPELEVLGHQVVVDDYASGLHAIRVRPDGTLEGGADPRREGIVAGE